MTTSFGWCCLLRKTSAGDRINVEFTCTIEVVDSGHVPTGPCSTKPLDVVSSNCFVLYSFCYKCCGRDPFSTHIFQLMPSPPLSTAAVSKYHGGPDRCNLKPARFTNLRPTLKDNLLFC